MSSIVLSHKAQKLMKLCDIEGFENVEAILFSSITDTVCPAICMTEGCDHTAELEPDSREGYEAATRARDRLLISGLDPGSEFLGDLR
jgi:hypothetical protein